MMYGNRSGGSSVFSSNVSWKFQWFIIIAYHYVLSIKISFIECFEVTVTVPLVLSIIPYQTINDVWEG